MKISEVTITDLANYCRLDEPSDIETAELTRMKDSAIFQICGYTGLTETELDDHEDITQALFLIVADEFDNRNLQMDGKGALNKSVDSILRMHSVNLL